MRKLIDRFAERLGYVRVEHFSKAHELLDRAHDQIERLLDHRAAVCSTICGPRDCVDGCERLAPGSIVITTDFKRGCPCS